MPDQDPLLVAIGHVLRGMRRQRRLSQEELSLQCGVHRNYIGGLERGERQPSVRTVATLATALGYPTSEVFLRAEAMLHLQRSAA